MKRFILSTPPDPEGLIRLYKEDYHYLVRVRRLKAGMCFEAALPGGTETHVRILSVQILSIEDDILIGKCLGRPENRLSSLPQLPPLALFQGLTKGSKMDLIIRQAAEGEVSLIAPFESEYSTARLKDAQSPSAEAEKVKRWERIVREARQQSGSTIETKVLPPCSIDALFESWESLKNKYKMPVGILLHQTPLENGSFHDYLDKNPDFVALAVGPEGGFSPGEVSRFLAAGWKPLVMGNTVLRTETAALYGTAVIRIILWEKKRGRQA